MIEVLEPQHPLLRTFVDSVYVLRKGGGSLEFTAYPGINTPVGLFRNAVMSIDSGAVYIDAAETPDHFAVACNQFSSGLRLRYIRTVDEIAINFKPLGFASFSDSTPRAKSCSSAMPGLLHCRVCSMPFLNRTRGRSSLL